MKKALIVVDFQNDFVDGSLGFPEASSLDEKICERIKEYRAQGGDVIFTFDTHYENYLETAEGKNLPVPHCLENSKGWELFGKVGESCLDSDVKLIKNTFGSDKLMAHLKEKGYSSVELCGLVSNICVISNAVIAKAALPEAEIIVDANLTKSFDSELNEKTLDVMSGLQIKVLNR